MTKRGVVYIAIGDKAERAAERSIASLRQYYDGDITVVSDRPITIPGIKPRYCSIAARSNVEASRWCKVRLNILTRYEHTMYIDADTIVRGPIDAGFDVLDDGYDLALAHSAAQEEEALWHVDLNEAWFTLCQLYGSALQLQAGVMFFRHSVANLFWEWRCEWQKWRGQDQAALLRALYKVPTRLWILGRSWNGGSIIEHRFGGARE
jgi:hypothetical protein